jgi:uncharacterized membrane protein YkoI
MRLVAQEVVIGLWLGGLARILALAMAMAGQAIATLIGLQGVLVSDPSLGAQATALGRAFALLTAVLVLSGGLYAIALRALVESYALIPAGAALPAGLAAESIAAAGAASLELALRLAAPFVIAAVVLNIALGLLARLAPQVQTFFIAIPGQILAGLALLALLPLPSPVHADDDDADHDRARAAVLRGEALPLDQILARLPLREGERLIEAEFDREDGRWVYELEFLGTDGRVRELEVDALSAAILEDD